MTDDERQRLKQLTRNLKRRDFIYKVIRAFFHWQGFLEVETPVRSPAIAPEKEIIPIESGDWFLSTSPELYMKRLLAADYDKIFQFSHCFRKDERGKYHNPEFTLLEWYRKDTSYEQMMKDTEQLVTTIAYELGLGTALQLRYCDKTIDLSLPWERVTVSEAFKKLAGWDPVVTPEPQRFDEDTVLKVIPNLNPNRPTFLVDYPSPMASLARLKPDNPHVAERAEVFIGGLELANAYSELVNHGEQEKRFQKEIEHIKKTQNRHAPMPEKFLKAVPNMPECSGIALGVDRLVMLFCNAASIDEVIPFPVDEA
ncbi:MAG: EF-P lysine aminoacylase EpmA [Dehalococcoidales bacterium]|nr:EF-P lysine aminoacylase EpmA [Dehalococcoidales bacterium]